VTRIDFPYHVDGHGRTADTDAADHVRDLVEQLLFTAPGERVNRPTFGSGLLRLVFEPNRVELATALEALVQGSLQQWLGELIRVEDATVAAEDSALHVTVTYTRVSDGERRVARFTGATA
jgi:phage baseplate assembly protein W